MNRSEKDAWWRTLNIKENKHWLRWFGQVKRRDKNRVLRNAMELEVKDRNPVCRPKKIWIKVLEEDMRKLNITEDMAEDRQQ